MDGRWSAYFRPLLAKAMVGEASVDEVMKAGATKWNEFRDKMAKKLGSVCLGGGEYRRRHHRHPARHLVPHVDHPTLPRRSGSCRCCFRPRS